MGPRHLGASLLLALALAGPAAAQPVETDAKDALETGILQMAEGDFENAIFSLDTAARELQGLPQRRAELVQAFLHLGACYAAIDEETLSRAKFRRALKLDSRLTLGERGLPAKTARLFEAERARVAAERSRRTRSVVIGAATVVGAGGGVAWAKSKEEQIVFVPPENRSPAVTIEVYPTQAVIMDLTSVTFTANATDPDGDSLTYQWDFGDGEQLSGVQVTHRYSRSGTFVARLTVSDNAGHSVSREQTLMPGSLSGRWRDTSVEDACAAEVVYTITQSADQISGSAPTYRQAVTLTGTLIDPRYVILDRSAVPIYNDAGVCGWSARSALRCLGKFADDLNSLECAGYHVTLARVP